nr:ATP-binding cassette sub-family A member 17-like [Dermacentor andersoni]
MALIRYSGELYHSSVIALNLVHTSLLRWTVGDDTATIKLRVRPQRNLEESVEYDKNSPEVIQRQLERFTFGAMSLAMMTSASGLFPVVDRTSGCRQLQLLTGLSIRIYWLGNFIFDYVVYALSGCTFCATMFLFFGAFFIEMIQPILFILIVYGMCAVPFAYLLALGANTPTTGYALVLLASFFGAFMASVSITAQLVTTASSIWFVLLSLLPLLRLLPSFSFMSAFQKVVSKSQIAWICSRSTLHSYRRVCIEPVEGFSVAVQEERQNNADFVEYCCPEFMALGHTKVPDFQPSVFDVVEVFFMLLEGAIFFALLLYLDGGGLSRFRENDGPMQKGTRRVAPVHTTMEEDVEAEEARVRSQALDNKLETDVVAILEFCKVYRKRLVVNGISLGVAEGEVLALLGVPGSGKSTLLRMIATDVPHDRGRALMKTPRGTITMHSAPARWQAGLGYCPQQDGLLEQLTGAETLALFARLRGVPETKVVAVTRDIANLMRLGSVIGDYVETYSGGLRRRLSVGVALVGLPPLVLLDEPTAGVDVAARRDMWQSVRELQEVARLSVIMTTGSMEEVEEVCDRLAIMIDGELQCLGSLSHLKAKFAQGYTMAVKMHDEYKDDYEYGNKLIRAIADTFPDSKIQQSLEGFLEYHMADTGLPWSELFAQAESIKRKHNVLELLISATTLDHVYAALARWERGRARMMAAAASHGADEENEED